MTCGHTPNCPHECITTTAAAQAGCARSPDFWHGYSSYDKDVPAPTTLLVEACGVIPRKSCGIALLPQS
eukprot:scaffold68292_cov37-Tisochrysis_lutea.AAC.3